MTSKTGTQNNPNAPNSRSRHFSANVNPTNQTTGGQKNKPGISQEGQEKLTTAYGRKVVNVHPVVSSIRCFCFVPQ